jgi:hypothetical protein
MPEKHVPLPYNGFADSELYMDAGKHLRLFRDEPLAFPEEEYGGNILAHKHLTCCRGSV